MGMRRFLQEQVSAPFLEQEEDEYEESSTRTALPSRLIVGVFYLVDFSFDLLLTLLPVQCADRRPVTAYLPVEYDVSNFLYRHNILIFCSLYNTPITRYGTLTTQGSETSMVQTLANRLMMAYTGDEGHGLFTSHAWRRLFEIRGSLVREFMLEFFSTCRMSDTELRLDEADTLDPVRRLCHKMITYSISGRGQAPEKVTGRKNGARLSRGHFIRRLAAHFGLVSDEGLMGLIVIAREPPLIDMDELVKLNICVRIGDTWAWVAPELERQQATVAEVLKGVEGAHVEIEGDQAVPAPLQAPQPPPTAQARTMPQRITRVEEEVRELRQRIIGPRRRLQTQAPEKIYESILGFGIRRIGFLYRPCCKEIDELVMVYSGKRRVLNSYGNSDASSTHFCSRIQIEDSSPGANIRGVIAIFNGDLLSMVRSGNCTMQWECR
ncbi:hypothetical protein Tco_1024057, partial [Tanacetum coccineum]